VSDPTDDQKPQPGSADSEQRPSSDATGAGAAAASDAARTERISRDQLPGAGQTEPPPAIPRPGVAPSPEPPRPSGPSTDRPGVAAAPKPPTSPVPPRTGITPAASPQGPAGPSGPDDKTAFIPRSVLPHTGGKPSSAADPKTVAIPMVSDPSNAETTALPIQRPGEPVQPPSEQPTEQIRLGGKSGTDRVMPGGRSPITAPPATPRPGTGPKNTVPQGPSGPPQNAPVGDEAAPGGPRPPIAPPPTGAPSPADVQPTIPAPTMSPHTIAAPQRIPGAAPPMDAPAEAPAAPKRHARRWLLGTGAAVVVIVALIVVVVALASNSKNNTPEAKVTAAISAYTNALATGNLPDLQAATCGTQHDFYQSIAPAQYASVHKLAVDQRKIPKVDAVDSVQITGDKAVAQANVYTDADPTRTARTFDLQSAADGWKVCDSPK